MQRISRKCRGLRRRLWNVLASGLLVFAPVVQGVHRAYGQEAQEAVARMQVQVQGPQMWLPEGTILFGRLDSSARWLEHPVVVGIQKTEAFKKLWRTPEALQLRGGITIAEFALGMKLDRLAQSLTTGGAYLAIDKDTKGVALLLSTEGEEWLTDYLEKGLGFLRKDAKSKGNPDPVKEAEYRGFRGYKIQNAVFAQAGEWLILSNEGETLKAILDRKLDRGPSLSDVDWYRRAEQVLVQRDSSGEASDSAVGIDDSVGTFRSSAQAYAMVDWKSLRELAKGNDLFRGQAKDFGAELLLGGWLSVFSNADVGLGTFGFGEKGMEMRFWAPTESSWFGDARLHYVGPEARGRAPKEFEQGAFASLASMGTYRDLSQLWLRAGDLFDQNVNDQLAQADATLTTLFSGRDFGEDILGAIEPEIRMVVSEPRTSSEGDLQPALRLPGFALVGKLKGEGKLQRELKRTFQSFVGFLNVAGAQEGQPQLELGSEAGESGSIYWAQYVMDEEKDYSSGLPIQFNFEPTIAFVGDLVVLSSQRELAKTLTEQLAKPSGDGTDSEHQTWMSLDVAALQRVLEMNSNSLIAQSMLENGKTRVEAKRDLERISTVMELFERVRMSMQFQDQAVLRLEVDVKR
jgi:hypothetical protein